MAWETLTKFVGRSITAGIPRERIAQALQQAGWRKEHVQSALNAYAESDLPVAVPRPAISATARELFLYLMLFSSLHVSIVGLGTILYQLINLAFPDPADFYGYGYAAMVGGVESKLRSGLASLAVFLPAYLLIDHKIEQLKRADPGQGGSSVRRKLTYLTLYLTIVILMFDASSLVSFWLSGELDKRVLFKCLAIAALGAWVLGRYLGEMTVDEHFDTGQAPRRRLIALALLVSAALAAMVGAAMNIESPGAERRRQADEAREAALGQIDSSIMTYYRAYRKLPASLEEVARFQHLKFPRDPETGKSYQYRRKDELAYELCATFREARTVEDLIAETNPYNVSYSSPAFAEHPSGEHCFALEVKESPPLSGL